MAKRGRPKKIVDTNVEVIKEVKRGRPKKKVTAENTTNVETHNLELKTKSELQEKLELMQTLSNDMLKFSDSIVYDVEYSNSINYVMSILNNNQITE